MKLLHLRNERYSVKVVGDFIEVYDATIKGWDEDPIVYMESVKDLHFLIINARIVKVAQKFNVETPLFW